MRDQQWVRVNVFFLCRVLKVSKDRNAYAIKEKATNVIVKDTRYNKHEHDIAMKDERAYQVAHA